MGDDRRLYWVDGFLPRAQCKRILEELKFARWQPSGVTRRTGESLRSVLSPNRVSESTLESWFSSPLRRVIRALDRRLEVLIPHHRERREEWQATSYGKGGRFDYHYDSGLWSNRPGGERQYTVLLYLNTARLGGSTLFCELGVDVRARAGRLVVWTNITRASERDADMLHSSVPLRGGRKYVLVTWVHERRLPDRRKA
jgi:prolyl 4-hydroxylase